MTNMSQFICFIMSKGFNCNKPIKYNSFIRFGHNNENWLIFHGECGFFGNWKTGERFSWFLEQDRHMYCYRKPNYQLELDKQILDRQQKVALKALSIYQNARIDGDSLYLKNKHIVGLKNV